jgi:Ca2+-binding RTX toxin-like protein
VITSAAAASVAENQTAAIDVNATDDIDSEGAGLAYAITGGTDQGLFQINAATGVLSFLAAPPGDANADNDYQVQVTVTDSGLLTDVQDITITVTDVVETITISGTSGDDTLNGGVADEFIFGLAGNDTIDGGGGDDTLDGGIGADVLFGGSGADHLLGGEGIDILVGSDGADVLNGGSGGDQLLGGAGADTFVFSGVAGNDIVLDWEDGIDRLDFSEHSTVSRIDHLMITQSGVDTKISFDGGSVLLTNVTATDIDTSDLIF